MNTGSLVFFLSMAVLFIALGARGEVKSSEKKTEIIEDDYSDETL